MSASCAYKKWENVLTENLVIYITLSRSSCDSFLVMTSVLAFYTSPSLADVRWQVDEAIVYIAPIVDFDILATAYFTGVDATSPEHINTTALRK